MRTTRPRRRYRAKRRNRQSRLNLLTTGVFASGQKYSFWLCLLCVPVSACGTDASTSVPAAEPVLEILAPVPRVPGPSQQLFVKRFIANIRVQPNRASESLGYLRAGVVVMSKSDATSGNDGCRQGWFELESGGFVCQGSDVLAFEGRRPPERPPAQPDFRAPLPYEYGRTRRDNIAMYRRPPTDEEAAQYEGYRIPGAENVAETTAEGSAEIAALENAPAPTPMPVAAEPTPVATAEAASEGSEEESAITLDSLRGESGSVLARRMAQGFIVSLDRDMRSGPRRYWRTLSNGFVPYAALGTIHGSEFHGFALSDPADSADSAESDVDGGVRGLSLPLGFIMSSKVFGYVRSADGRVRRGRAPGYHFAFPIASTHASAGTSYVVAGNDQLFREGDARILRAATAIPRGIGENDHWIDVDLASQTLIAYEGLRPVYATLVSSGRVRDPADPLLDHRTPTGTFRIRSKHVTHTMDGDHAVDGPYSIEDVPYVMYFNLAYALHSAFWHDGFGRPRSHGCINLAPADARWIFHWATPGLPERWHAVYAAETGPSTFVYIHGETPEG